MKRYDIVVLVALFVAPSAAMATVAENTVNIPHSVYVDTNNPPCGPGGSSCVVNCVSYPWTQDAKFQVYISGIPGRPDGTWIPAAANPNPASANGQNWEWAATEGSSATNDGVTGRFCSTGKNWSHNTDRVFRVRVIY